MAVTRTDATQFSSTLKDGTTQTEVAIRTNTDEKRVTSISMYVTVGSSDSNTFTDAQKADVHDAIVKAVKNKMGVGI